MAIFGSKKKTAETKAGATASAEVLNARLSHILKDPRVTEKATIGSEKGVYTFNVAPAATKSDVVAAVKHFYNVTPVKVTMTKIPSKKITYRNRPGVKSGGKKASVYLKKGDTIDFV